MAVALPCSAFPPSGPPGAPTPEEAQLLLAHTADLLARCSPDGVVRQVTSACRALTGRDPAAVVGRSMYTFIDPADFILVNGLHRRVLAGDRPPPLVHRLRHAEGRVVWVETAARVMRHESCADACDLVLAARDVTAREQALREQEGLWQVMEGVLSLPVVVYRLDAEGTFTDLAGGGLRTLGLGREHLVGRNAFAVYPAYREEFRAVLKGGTAHFESSGSTGGQRWAFRNTLQFDALAGSGAIGFAVDITDRRLMEERLERLIQDLARSNQDLEQFAYVASHDLREPLRMISGFLALLERHLQDRLDDTGRDYMGYAVDGARRLDRLIADLLAYSRVGSGDSPRVAMPLAPVLERVSLTLAGALADCAGELVISGGPARVVGNGHELERLFQNLVGNALKYRAPQRPPRVVVDQVRQGDHWHITVADNGIGIAPEFHERIFRLFQRLHTEREYPGTGIGLAIANRIVTHHHGRLWVDSTPDVGTTFHLTLPAAWRG